MRLLILGGTRFVGRAIVADALARGWEVTAVHRGQTGALPDGVTTLLADRTSTEALRAALGEQSWDLAVDTWSGAPVVVADSVDLLRGRVRRYGYVSSVSVYVWDSHVDEASPLMDGAPRAHEGDYAACKRGAELAVLEGFPEALLCRAGLILGPYEDIGRLPWWLDRISRGGRVVAPGRPDRPLQYVDVRDLAGWLLSGLAGEATGEATGETTGEGTGAVAGAVDVISRSGHATTRDLLSACIAATGSDTELVWVAESALAEAGVEPWSQLPCWVPESDPFTGFLEADTALAAATGLVCRPVRDTVTDTWEWLSREGMPHQRPDRDVHGLPPDLEGRLLARAQEAQTFKPAR